jgi:hypothetical protein
MKRRPYFVVGLVIGLVVVLLALLGDVNNDGRVDGIDSEIVDSFRRKDYAGPYSLRDCDINANGKVNAADRAIVERIMRGKLGQDAVSAPCPLR